MNDIFKKGDVLNMSQLIDYTKGGIVSKQIIKNDAGDITLFSFDKEQGLSEHAAPFDAMLQILEGQAEVKIGAHPEIVKEGQTIILPANISHSLFAIERFKMLLTMIKENPAV